MREISKSWIKTGKGAYHFNDSVSDSLAELIKESRKFDKILRKDQDRADEEYKASYYFDADVE